MYILYIDESGDPYSWDEQNHFVLAGVAVHEGQVRNITSKLTRFRINSSLISILSCICTHTHSDKGRGISENLIPQNVNNYWILFTA